MTNEEKQLLLKDLCGRLPYGVIIHNEEGYEGHLNSINQTIFGIELGVNITATHRVDFQLDTCKPYLRPMSSLIGKELDECRATCKYRRVGQSVLDCATPQTIDYLVSHHFDYRGLIPMGLALEAHEDMYKTE